MTNGSISPTALARELRATIGWTRRRLNDGARNTGSLTPSQSSLLARIHRDGPRSASALAAAEHVRPQSASATIAALEARALVTRSPDPHDGRQQLVALTDAGRALLGDRTRDREGWLGERLASLSGDERELVLHALGLLRAALEHEDPAAEGPASEDLEPERQIGRRR